MAVKHVADVTTATVEVKILTVNGRQVTLAFFRQLVEETPSDGATFWGRVNYCPNRDCSQPSRDRNLYGKWPEHEHLIWQRGDELRRATVWRGRVDTTLFRDRAIPATGAHLDAEVWQYVLSLPQLFIAV